jgi:hypothetical protein
MRPPLTEAEAAASVTGRAVAYVNCIHEFGEQEGYHSGCLCSSCTEHFADLAEAVERLKQVQEAAFAASGVAR